MQLPKKVGNGHETRVGGDLNESADEIRLPYSAEKELSIIRANRLNRGGSLEDELSVARFSNAVLPRFASRVLHLEAVLR